MKFRKDESYQFERVSTRALALSFRHLRFYSVSFAVRLCSHFHLNFLSCCYAFIYSLNVLSTSCHTRVNFRIFLCTAVQTKPVCLWQVNVVSLVTFFIDAKYILINAPISYIPFQILSLTYLLPVAYMLVVFCKYYSEY